MNKEMTVNGKSYTIIKLLGKGKGGYSYLAESGNNRYVLKQIHHEPCDYYQFGNKLEAEIRDYIVVHNEEIYYVDFECNDYMEEWDFENWGVKYWSKTPEFLQYVKEHS